jgi:hypothetical protein
LFFNINAVFLASIIFFLNILSFYLSFYELNLVFNNFNLNLNWFLNISFFWLDNWFLHVFLLLIFILYNINKNCLVLILCLAKLYCSDFYNIFISSYSTNYMFLNTTFFNVLLNNQLNKIHPPIYHSLFIFFISYLFKNYYLFNKNNVFKHIEINYFILKMIIFTISLGSWWAFQEGNWGGWWNWDPSEFLSLFIIFSILTLLHKKTILSSFLYIYLRLLFILVINLLNFLILQLNFSITSHNFGNSFFIFFNNYYFLLIILILLLVLVFNNFRIITFLLKSYNEKNYIIWYCFIIILFSYLYSFSQIILLFFYINIYLSYYLFIILSLLLILLVILVFNSWKITFNFFFINFNLIAFVNYIISSLFFFKSIKIIAHFIITIFFINSINNTFLIKTLFISNAFNIYNYNSILLNNYNFEITFFVTESYYYIIQNWNLLILKSFLFNNFISDILTISVFYIKTSIIYMFKVSNISNIFIIIEYYRILILLILVVILSVFIQLLYKKINNKYVY